MLTPEEKWPAHVTVAGPVTDKRRIAGDLDFRSRISTLGVGKFVNNKKITIYIRVDAVNLRHIWHKPDFPYNPHITIYDGDDVSIANSIYNGLRDLKFYSSFLVDRAHWISTEPGQSDMNLRANIDPVLLANFGNMTTDNVREFPIEDRVRHSLAALELAKRSALAFA
jgi:hypothetical protein